MSLLDTTQPLTVGQKKISAVKGNSQIVMPRVHWLPVYAPNTIVEAIFRPFGKVLSVNFDKMKIGSASFKSGVR
jgi:hypothetical protein